MNPKQSFYKRNDELILGAISILLFLGIWQAVWDLKLISALFFTGPSEVAKKFRELWLMEPFFPTWHSAVRLLRSDF